MPENLQTPPRIVSERTPASVGRAPPACTDTDSETDEGEGAKALSGKLLPAVAHEGPDLASPKGRQPKLVSRKRAKASSRKTDAVVAAMAAEDVDAPVPSTPASGKSIAGDKRKGRTAVEAPETPPVVEAPGHSRVYTAAELVKLRGRVPRKA